MSLNYNPISVAELDFETIKESLKTFLRGQADYTDFDFEGSGMNILLDVLAQNSSINAFMASMMGNEAFIDSAQMRQSVVSLAKQIGYTPRSTRSAKAEVTISVSNVTGSPSFLSMPTGTKFTGAGGMSFTTIEEYKLYPTGVATTYEAQDVVIYEGYNMEYNYTVDSTNSDQKFLIKALTADTSTLKVYIKANSSSSSKLIYTKNNNINVLDENSLVYFLQENLDEYYEVYFGDGILGKKLSDGNIVNMNFVISSQPSDANNISVFTAKESIDGYGSYSIITQTKSYGGAVKQDIDEIRHIAPKMYQSQFRAVIKEDYLNFLVSEYPWIDSINVWGGEDNIPPQYGKVFISIKPVHSTVISESVREEIKTNLLKNYNVVTVIPEIIDSSYIYVSIAANVQYNRNLTTLTENELGIQIETNVDQYFVDTTKRFNRSFYLSPLTSKIDNTDASIISTLIDVKFQLRFIPTINLLSTYVLEFWNPIQPGTLISTVYNHSYMPAVNASNSAQYLMDDGNGIIISKSVYDDQIIFSNIGTIDYETGKLSLTLYPYELPEDSLDIRIQATPVTENIEPGFNQIILPDDSLFSQLYRRAVGINITLTSV